MSRGMHKGARFCIINLQSINQLIKKKSKCRLSWKKVLENKKALMKLLVRRCSLFEVIYMF